MRLDNVIDEIKASLRESDELSQVSFITAFPNLMKSTRLDKIVVSLGVYELDVSSVELDSNDRAGQLSIFADIYAPLSFAGNTLMNTLTGICRVLDKYCIVRVKTYKPSYNKLSQAIVMKTIITFSDRITFGGDENE